MSQKNGVATNPKSLLERLNLLSAVVSQKTEEEREQRRIEAEQAQVERGRQAKLAAEAVHSSLIEAELACADLKSQLQAAEQVFLGALQLGMHEHCRELEDIQIELNNLLAQTEIEQVVVSHLLDAMIDNLQSLGLVFSLKEEKQKQAVKATGPTALDVFRQSCNEVVEGYQLAPLRASLKEFEGEDRAKAQRAINSTQRRIDESPARELLAKLDKSLEFVNSSRAIELKREAEHMLRQGDYRSAFEKAEEATSLVSVALKVEEDRTRRIKAEASKKPVKGSAKKKD